MDLDLCIDSISSETSPYKDSYWEILVEQVIKGNVIPVIGSGLTKVEGNSISDILVSKISPLCNMRKPAKNFSQLIPRFQVEHKDRDIYKYVYDILNNESNDKILIPSDELKELLTVKYFPFVIYTSYDSIVEKAMKEIHKDKLRIFTFDNNPDSNDDIPALDNLKIPTLYYILGKANNLGRKYVLSDKDMLDFSRSWLSETDNVSKVKPANLSNALSNKFLLVLGCGYSDWLFRFIWFAMKDSKIKRSEDERKIGLLTINDSANEEFIDFMTRSNTLTQTMPTNDFIKELCKRIALREKQLGQELSQMKFDKPLSGTDVFISYSRADKTLAELLYSILTDMGLNVWYDKKNLGVGAEFWKDIRYAIRTTTLFVPILTNSIKEQYYEEHVYRDEWKEAINRKQRLGNVAYICPLCTDGFDLEDRNSDIPEELKTHNIRTISMDNIKEDLFAFAKEIKNKITNLLENDR